MAGCGTAGGSVRCRGAMARLGYFIGRLGPCPRGTRQKWRLGSIKTGYLDYINPGYFVSYLATGSG